MHRSSKFIVVAGALAALAVPSVASANVAVDNGVGFVGKGDVQTALGYANDAAIQQAVKDGKVKFIGGGYTLTTDKDTSWTCSDGSSQHHHFLTTTTATGTANAVARSNPQGKVTTGWDINGFTTGTPTTTGVGSDGNRFPSYDCPAGSNFTGMSVNQTHEYTPDTGLSVTNGVKTVALPNTPAEVAPAA
jgi:hypothetical protein